jgi:desampylase
MSRITTVVSGSEVVRSVLQEALRARPEEACGLLVGTAEGGCARVGRVVACRNTAPPELRRRRFEIDPARVIQEERSLRGSTETVLGFYHSHPVGESVPSEWDLRYMALWPDAVWMIASRLEEGERASLRAWVWDPEAPETPRELGIARPTP